MSRIGKVPIEFASTVKVDIKDDLVKVEGPKGKLEYRFNASMDVSIEGNQILVKRPSDAGEHKALHGLTRTMISNMVEGVTDGFSKTLQIIGVGYRAQLKGKAIDLSLGFSHPIEYPLPEGITAEISKKQDEIVISGIDKQLVGQVAADLRSYRKPEPYKGKGVRYKDEYVRRKQGKSVG